MAAAAATAAALPPTPALDCSFTSSRSQEADTQCSPFGQANDSNSSGSTSADSEDSMSVLSPGSIKAGGASIAAGRGTHKAAPRQKINARERYRTFNVNSAYEALRFLIPTEPVDRKLSKIEIIRLASSYITHLRSTLHMGTDHNPCLLQRGKYEFEGNNNNNTLARVSICTFCMKPK